MHLLERLRTQFFSNQPIYCENPEQDIYADFSEPIGMSPQPPSRTKELIPNYKHVMMLSIKRLTMNGKMFDVPGFKLFYMLPLSQRFMMQSEFILNPKVNPYPKDYIQLMMMGQQKDPFYMMSLNYVGGKFPDILKRPSYNISTRVGTHGMVDFIVAKPWKNIMFKLNSIAQKRAGKIIPMFALEVEHEGRFSNQQLVLTGETVELNSFTKLGQKLYFGLELVHAFSRQMTLLGFLAKYKRTPFETYYANYQDMQGLVTLGSVIKINKKMTMATELELSDQYSTATVGLSRRFGNFELNSSMNTNSVIKTNFNIKKGLFKLKMFLNAKLGEEDFNTGIHLSINPMGDM